MSFYDPYNRKSNPSVEIETWILPFQDLNYEDNDTGHVRIMMKNNIMMLLSYFVLQYI
jgi:hypothetical protein